MLSSQPARLWPLGFPSGGHGGDGGRRLRRKDLPRRGEGGNSLGVERDPKRNTPVFPIWLSSKLTKFLYFSVLERIAFVRTTLRRLSVPIMPPASLTGFDDEGAKSSKHAFNELESLGVGLGSKVKSVRF